MLSKDVWLNWNKSIYKKSKIRFVEWRFVQRLLLLLHVQSLFILKWSVYRKDRSRIFKSELQLILSSKDLIIRFILSKNVSFPKMSFKNAFPPCTFLSFSQLSLRKGIIIRSKLFHYQSRIQRRQYVWHLLRQWFYLKRNCCSNRF